MGDIIRRTLGNGRVAYYARYIEADGRRTSRATRARTPEDALKFLYALEARVRAGQVGLAAPTKEERAERAKMREASAATFRQLSERFLAEYNSPKLKDPKDYRKETKSTLKVRVWPFIGDKVAADVTARDLDAMRDHMLSKSYSPRSVVIAAQAISKVYEWARRQGLDLTNPVADFEKPTVGPSSLEFLSKSEVGRLLAYAEEHAPELHPMIATAIYTGMRKGELFGLRWQDVHLDAARIDVMRSYKLAPKSGKPRHLPMHPELVRVLRGWEDRFPANPGGLVFPVVENEDGMMGKGTDMLGLNEVMKAAKVKVPEREWHAMRHTFASHFMMAGGNILTLQKLLGHGSVQMTMIYAHLAPDFMAAEVARMSFPVPVAGISDLSEARRQRAMDTQRETVAMRADKVTA